MNLRNFNIYIIYNMPAKIKMFLLNGNYNYNNQFPRQINYASLGTVPSVKAPSALNSSIIARIHNVRAGCGSCGR